MTTEVLQDTIPAAVDNVPDALELPALEAVAVPDDAVAEAEPTSEVATETAPPPRPLSDLPDEELPPDVRDLLRRREQSARDRATEAARKQADAQLQQYVARGDYAEDIAAAYSVDEMTGAVSADRQKIGEVVGRLQSALAQQQSARAYDVLNGMLPYESLSSADRDRIRDAGAEWMNAYVSSIAQAEAQKLLPAMQKQWEADFKKQQQARATVAEREAASAARQTANATPGLTGGAPRTFESKRELDRAHMAGEITTAQVREWRDSGRYAALPF